MQPVWEEINTVKKLSAIKLTLKKPSFYIIGIYRQYNNFDEALGILSTTLDSIHTWNSPTVIMSDINIDCLETSGNNKKLQDTLKSHNITRQPTTYTSHPTQCNFHRYGLLTTCETKKNLALLNNLLKKEGWNDLLGSTSAETISIKTTCYQAINMVLLRVNLRQQPWQALLNILTSALDVGDTTTAIFLDFTKAFDCLSHDLLLKKLEDQLMEVENSFLKAMYLLKKDEYLSRYETVEEKELFHVTGVDNVKSITNNNFDWRRVSRGLFGKGTSFSGDAEYANCHANHNIVNKVQVLEGRGREPGLSAKTAKKVFIPHVLGRAQEDLHEYTSSLLQVQREKKDSPSKTMHTGANNTHPLSRSNQRLHD
ncbi:hypothetical protein J6590_033182 [Homalodisca vitripennis]|nr:hypothetical protein J6590_033182 [Homalodisca vitripennis]